MMTLRTGRSEEAELVTQPGETGARVIRILRVQAVAGGWEGAEVITGQGEARVIEARRGAAGEAQPRVKRGAGVAVEEGQEADTTDCTGAAGTG